MAYLTQYSSSVPVIKFHIDQTLMTIGQHIDMDICVPEDGIADSHAAVEAIKELESYRYIIKSNEDEPLLELNGKNVAHAELQDGDWLIIGGVEFQFTDDGVNEIKETLSSTPELKASKPTHEDIVTPKPTTSEPVKVEASSSPKQASALELIKELKEEVESITTKDLVEDNQFSRRLRLF